jgi:hypothetical protein
MVKAVGDFLFGLCFGMGFALAAAILQFIGHLISQAR